MPVVEISMVRGRTRDEIRQIADGTHAALVNTYGIPAEDRFQLVRQYEEHELLFDATFAGGPRTRDFLLVRVTAGRPRPIEVKRAFYNALVTELEACVGLDPENVMVMLGNVEMSDLSLGGGRPFDLPGTAEPNPAR